MPRPCSFGRNTTHMYAQSLTMVILRKEKEHQIANFMQFVHKIAEIDDVWKLWVDFVFTNCYCYLTLYLVFRHSNWKLRLSSLKEWHYFLLLLIVICMKKLFLSNWQILSMRNRMLRSRRFYSKHYRQKMAFSSFR